MRNIFIKNILQANGHEYDLVLMPDINSSRHHQWFYFEVTNMEANKSYIFNIVNCEKHASQFNYGESIFRFLIYCA